METSKKVAFPLTDIPDHLLSEILLRLPTSEDLARASAVCVSFRRISTDGSFLRRFRRLHAAPLLGFLDRNGFHPVLPPHPSAPAARALDLAADLSFSFLPAPRHWAVQDIRDGRVLLDRRIRQEEFPAVLRELVVCDPLRRRYVLLPTVPDDLTALLEHPVQMVRGVRCKTFLAPLGEEEAAAGEATFRVVLMAHCKTSLTAFVFSSSTGQWQAAASKGWSDLVSSRGDWAAMSQVNPVYLRRHYAYGCFYWDWLMIKSKKLLVLDIRTMEFSIADLPPGEWGREGIAIVEAGEGRLGMFGFHGGIAPSLSYTIALNKGESPSQWQVEKTISQDSGYTYSIIAATERYLLLTRIEASYLENRLLSLEKPRFEYFLMDAETLQLQTLYMKQHCLVYDAYIYINFPPSLLSSRTV
ncbi:uncharacterized protein LOC119337880 [Triticum dicoccoides]|uniref:uncharacterized protein LOC119337880 n=1 Tax=Triticum dicoccoides TaxID=85692 RepID=UPI000E7B6897|nr:uncharacterized protein LOC119337880 [Triticum dicoccoides]